MNMHKFLANAVVFAGFVAVPFIPFIVLGQSTFFPFIVGKNFAFRAVVEIMFSAWIVLAFIDPEYRPKKSYIFWAFTALLALITISAIFGADPEKSFWSNFERMEGVVTYFHLFAYFVVASTVLTARDMWRPYLNLHLGAGVIMAIYGVLQWAGTLAVIQDGTRVNGTLGNAEYLGTYALFNIFLAAFLMFRGGFQTTSGHVRGAMYSLIIILQTFVLYHTGTRGAMLGLIVGVGVTTLLLAIFEKHNKTIRKSAIGILIGVVVLVGGFIAFRNASFIAQSPVLSRFATISLSDGTSHARLMVWGMALKGVEEHPILGWGMDNFGYVFSKYYDPNMWGQEQWFDRAHNVLFDWLVSGGILGLLAYLSLFGVATYYIWRHTEKLSIVEKSVLTGLLGGYLFQNLFVFDNLSSLIYFGTILAYVESVSHKKEKGVSVVEKKKKRPADAEDLTFLVSGGAFILAVTLLYTVNYNGFMQNTTLIRALTERSDDPMNNLSLFKDAIAYDSFGTAEVREQLASFATNAFDQTKGISDIQKQFIALAKDELEKQAAELPTDTRSQLFAGTFLSQIGDQNNALVYLDKALALSPTKQTILFELGSAYYAKKDMVKTEEMFKRAYELAPEFPDAEKFYLQILAANGKQSLMKQILSAHPLPATK